MRIVLPLDIFQSKDFEHMSLFRGKFGQERLRVRENMVAFNTLLIVCFIFSDYDGATLMHCALHPTLDYVNFPNALSRARDITGQRMEALSGGSVVYKVRKKQPKEGNCILVLMFILIGSRSIQGQKEERKSGY